MDIIRITRTYRSMQRVREIVTILSRHGFSRMLQATGLGRFMPVSQRMKRAENVNETVTAPEQLRFALDELGPTFIKLGQMLASRPDLVPEPYVEELRKLQDEVSPFPFEEVCLVVEEQTGLPMDECFKSVDEQPMAAASIAQVHRAVLIDGTPVVLKVRRPGIKNIINRDLSVLQLLITAAERYMPESRELDLPTILDEFSRTIRRELDFYLEASHTERIKRNFGDDEQVVIPAIHWEMTGESLVVMDELEGFAADDIEGIDAAGIDRVQVAKIAARCFMKQVFEDGVFHADLHAGNVRVTAEGKLGLLDFGAVGFLSEEIQESLGTFLMALLSRDYTALVDEFMHIGTFERAVDMRRFERDLRELIEPYFGRPLGELRFGEIMKECVAIALRHHIRVPADMVLLARSTISIEGIVRQLDPELGIIEEAEPFAKELIAKRLDPRRQWRAFSRAGRDYKHFLTRLPTQLGRIFQQLLDSRLSIDFVHRGYEKALDEMDRSSNRISASLIISALIVGSALIVLSGKGPMLWDFPVFGIVGFILAAVMGFGLAIQILRSGKF